MNTSERHKAAYEANEWSTARPNCPCDFCAALKRVGLAMSKIKGMD